jgi:carotenoid 1,2-hydratase
MDSNEGDEPIDRAFDTWDWSRSTLADGSTAVIYDVRPKGGGERVIAQRFALDGSSVPLKRHRATHCRSRAWRIERHMRSEAGLLPVLQQTLEDTPFYARSTLSARLLGETVTTLHESLDVPRVVSLPVRLMLPWRMPRRG